MKIVFVAAPLLSASFIMRTAVDWFAPPADFHTRSAVSTYVAIGILLTAGCWAAWRAGSFLTGALAGVTTAAIAAVMSAIGAAILLAIWHDPTTMSAIRASGGLAEVFTLPFAIVLPAALVGAAGGAIARLLPNP